MIYEQSTNLAWLPYILMPVPHEVPLGHGDGRMLGDTSTRIQFT
jgi:hypothetical protein